MGAKAITIKNFYEQNIPIDDGMDGDMVTAGETFPIRIRRFTLAQLQKFQRGFDQMQHPSAERFIFRKPDGDEQATRPDGLVYVVPQSEIERRRVADMGPETAAEYAQAQVNDDTFNAAFCAQVITDHIWLPPGVTIKVVAEDETEIEVRDGAGLVKAFGGNYWMLTRLVRAIYQENVLSPADKKKLRRQSGSTTSSPQPDAAAAAAGPIPDATAASAGTRDSVSSGDVSADQHPIPSGSGELVAKT